jgi:carbonic anhydrase
MAVGAAARDLTRSSRLVPTPIPRVDKTPAMTMPDHLFTRRRRTAVAMTLCLAALPALAAEPKAVAPKSDARTAEIKAPKARAGDLKPAEPRIQAPEPGSLDAIRDKLAQKLGAAGPRDAKAPHVVRVAARAPGEFQVAAARPVARAAAPRATKPGAGGHAAWSYQGETGPEAWGALKPDFAKCATGTRQSPIDIRDGIHVDLEPVRFDYQASNFGVVDNGHTVQVNVGAGNAIEVLGRRYELVQFHFHRPSEERINGRQFDMVAHLVHKDLDGRQAVVAVLLDRGSAQPVVQAVWNNLPLEKGEEVAARVVIDLNHLLPQDRRYFTYMGSLTTPPCSEGVLWMVMQQPVTLSAEQIDIFARLYPMNARPIQSVSGRLIKASN